LLLRGLQAYLNQRRKLLSYLRQDNFPRYAYVIHKLGLKDTYARQVSGRLVRNGRGWVEGWSNPRAARGKQASC
jgi:hypothetical protein